LTSQISSSQRRRSSNKRKSPSRSVNSSKRGNYVPLLPDIIGISAGSQWHQQDEIITQGGQILANELWTTESLVDKLTSHIIQVKEEENKQPNSTGSSSYDRKYLNCAVAVITNWSKIEQNHQHHQFVFSLSDIMTGDGRLTAELIDLGRTAPSTLAYVLHKVVQRLFELVGASWFYQSASVEIQVRFDP
jgi:hypothetical protein